MECAVVSMLVSHVAGVVQWPCAQCEHPRAASNARDDASTSLYLAARETPSMGYEIRGSNILQLYGMRLLSELVPRSPFNMCDRQEQCSPPLSMTMPISSLYISHFEPTNNLSLATSPRQSFLRERNGWSSHPEQVHPFLSGQP